MITGTIEPIIPIKENFLLREEKTITKQLLSTSLLSFLENLHKKAGKNPKICLAEQLFS